MCDARTLSTRKNVKCHALKRDILPFLRWVAAGCPRRLLACQSPTKIGHLLTEELRVLTADVESGNRCFSGNESRFDSRVCPKACLQSKYKQNRASTHRRQIFAARIPNGVAPAVHVVWDLPASCKIFSYLYALTLFSEFITLYLVETVII